MPNTPPPIRALSLLVASALLVGACRQTEAKPASENLQTVLVESPKWVQGRKTIQFSALAKAHVDSDEATPVDEARRRRDPNDRGRFFVSVPSEVATLVDTSSPAEVSVGWGRGARQPAKWIRSQDRLSLEVTGFVDLLDGLRLQVEANLKNEVLVLSIPHRALISPTGRGLEVWTVHNDLVSRSRVMIVRSTRTRAEVVFLTKPAPKFDRLIRAGHQKTSPGRRVSWRDDI
jgi:hypothetical protein